MSLTAVLWPNGTGEGGGAFTFYPSGTWQCLDDLSESDYCYVTNNTSEYLYAFFAMQDLSIPANAIIEKVRVDLLADANYGGYCKPAIKSGGTYSSGSWNSLSGTKTVFGADWTTNPATGGAWTQSSVNSLLIGLYIRSTSGISNVATAYWLRCTVTYLLPSGARSQIIGLW
jgi:hypothetical protein